MGRKKVTRKATGLNLASLSVSEIKQLLAAKEKQAGGKLTKLEAKRDKLQAQLDKVLKAIVELGGEVKPATGKKRGRPAKVSKTKKRGRPAKTKAEKAPKAPKAPKTPKAPKASKAPKARKKQAGVAEAVVDILTQGGTLSAKDIDQALRTRDIVVNALGTYLSKLVSGNKITRPSRGKYAVA